MKRRPGTPHRKTANEIDKCTEAARKKPPVTLATIPSLSRPLPSEQQQKPKGES
jgi:hypothetical protein